MNHFDQIYQREPIVVKSRKGGRRELNMAPALTWDQVMEIRKLHREGKSYQQLANKYKVHRFTVSRAAQGLGTYARY